jgi:hypothetical protein
MRLFFLKNIWAYVEYRVCLEPALFPRAEVSWTIGTAGRSLSTPVLNVARVTRRQNRCVLPGMSQLAYATSDAQIFFKKKRGTPQLLSRAVGVI